MIHVDVIPRGCVCGWLAMGFDDGACAPWRLVRPEPACPYGDAHVQAYLIQPSLEELPEWEVGP